jgi:hypothetical protein
MNKAKIIKGVVFVLALLVLALMFWSAKKNAVPQAPTSTFQGPPAGAVPYVKGPAGLPPK